MLGLGIDVIYSGRTFCFLFLLPNTSLCSCQFGVWQPCSGTAGNAEHWHLGSKVAAPLVPVKVTVSLICPGTGGGGGGFSGRPGQ